MNDVRTLLIELRRVGVHLWVEGDQIRYRAPKGVLSADRLAELKQKLFLIFLEPVHIHGPYAFFCCRLISACSLFSAEPGSSVLP